MTIVCGDAQLAAPGLMYKRENGMYSSSRAVDVGLVQYPTENRLVPHGLDVQDSPCVLKIRTAWIIMNEGESVVGEREATIADPGNDFTGWFGFGPRLS